MRGDIHVWCRRLWGKNKEGFLRYEGLPDQDLETDCILRSHLNFLVQVGGSETILHLV